MTVAVFVPVRLRPSLVATAPAASVMVTSLRPLGVTSIHQSSFLLLFWRCALVARPL